MANLGFAFNPKDYEPFSDFSMLPKGEWNVVISKSEIDQTDPQDTKLVLTFAIVEGSEKGKELTENFFLWAPKDGSKSGGKGEISRRKMTTINNAIGQFEQYNDSAVLHNRPFTIKTDIEYKLKNDGSGAYIGFARIKSYKSFVGNGQASGADPVQPLMPGAAVPAAGGAPSLPFAAPQVPVAPAMPAAPYAPPAAPAAPAAPAGFPGLPAGFPTAPAQQGGAFAPPMAAQPFAPPAAPGAFQPAPGAAAPGGFGGFPVPGR